MRIAVVQGTRPEIIKNYSIVRALRAGGVPHEVLHTNQHHRHDMCDRVYGDMGYQPSRRLPGPYRLGAVIDWLQDSFRRDRISHVLVNGDTAAALAGALAGMYLDLQVAHVEAGLRSGDPFMYEERNRIMVDSIAHHLFAYTTFEVEYLRRAEEVRGSIHLEGNTTVDVLEDFADRIVAPGTGSPYVFVTMHRREFTEAPHRMALVFATLRHLVRTRCTVVFALHPRTADAMDRHHLDHDVLSGVDVIGPVTAFESFSLQRHAAAVLTDSGCIQEEAYLLGTPCITVRENTERHLTVQHGANTLTGFERRGVLGAVERALTTPIADWPPIYGAPGAGRRIVDRFAGDETAATGRTDCSAAS